MLSEKAHQIIQRGQTCCSQGETQMATDGQSCRDTTKETSDEGHGLEKHFSPNSLFSITHGEHVSQHLMLKEIPLVWIEPAIINVTNAWKTATGCDFEISASHSFANRRNLLSYADLPNFNPQLPRSTGHPVERDTIGGRGRPETYFRVILVTSNRRL